MDTPEKDDDDRSVENTSDSELINPEQNTQVGKDFVQLHLL